MVNLYGVKPSNSCANNCLPRLDLNHFESQTESPGLKLGFLSLSRQVLNVMKLMQIVNPVPHIIK